MGHSDQLRVAAEIRLADIRRTEIKPDPLSDNMKRCLNSDRAFGQVLA